MKGVFVTGTDTGVGKTFLAAALLKALREAGLNAAPMKPIQTGCFRRGAAWVAPDLEFSLNLAGVSPATGERELMAPYCFRPACSPHLAAREAGVRISIPRIAGALRRLKAGREFVVVEGAGGVLVPIDGRRTMLDLMVALDLPVILVARPGLGTINHTLLSLSALRQARLNVLGVVLNQAYPGRRGAIERDNRVTIARLGRIPVLADLRHGETVNHAVGQIRSLATLLCHGSTERTTRGRSPIP